MHASGPGERPASGSILAKTRIAIPRMAFITRITRLPGYVLVHVAGPSSIKDFVDLITAVAEDTVLWSDRKVVVDLRDVDGRPTTEEQIFIGELVAQNLSHLDRMASIVPSEQITRNSERAAQKLGTQLRVFDKEEDAVAWIGSAAGTAVAPAAGSAASPE
jgi:hypothetical protein